jgi:hypothetical protein
MSNALSSLTPLDACLQAKALPGAGILEYAPLDAMNQGVWEPAWSHTGYALNKSAGVASWFPMPYVQGSGSWEETPVTSDQGAYFSVAVSFALGGDSASIRREQDRMKNRRFLLRLTRQGTSVIMGTPEQPLRFESRFDSGAGLGDSRQSQCTFRGVALKKTPHYAPFF